MKTWNQFFEDLQGKSVAIIGFGVSNRPLFELVYNAGAKVTVCDKNTGLIRDNEAFFSRYPDVVFQLGDGYLRGLDQDYIFRSPGIRPDKPEIASAVQNGSVLTSEMELFFMFCPCKIIGITGSDGKTTTSTLISEILKAYGKTVYLGGNIGTPLLAEIPSMQADSVCVVELSSFQLQTMELSPYIAVITNIAPNHRDWHTGMYEYTYAKCRIFANQKKDDTLILNHDNPVTASLVGKARGNCFEFSSSQKIEKGAYLSDGSMLLADGEMFPVLRLEDILLMGKHNIENYMAAALAAYALCGKSVFPSVKKVAREFKGVEHRLELVRVWNGVRFYNDSIASSPTRTAAGLNAFPEKVILIAGGYDKKISYTPFGQDVVQHVKKLYLSGNTAAKIKESVENADTEKSIPIKSFPTFDEAVLAACREAQEGDIVLLSPASASFDQFKNFVERGLRFKKLVNSL